MSLRDLIRGTALHKDATDTPATLDMNCATVAQLVAELATVSVASPPRAVLQGGEPWHASDWRAFHDERAAILEFEGGIPRRQAEAEAWRACVAEWLNRNPVYSTAGRCHWCGEAAEGAPLLPYGSTGSGATWLHRECWQAWCEGRRDEAAAALKGLGIKPETEGGP